MLIKSLKYTPLFLCFGFLLLFSSCKNDVELNAPYKEMPSIYAVLNPYETTQTIRINKVFLGEGDANVMAKVSDSINYQPGEITVTLKHSSGSSITFTEALITAEPGAFGTTQRVYQTTTKLNADTNGVYTLIVQNNHTGNVFTATASPVPTIALSDRTGNLSPPYAPYNPLEPPSSYIDYANNKASVLFAIRSSKIALYQLIISSLFYEGYGSGNTTRGGLDYVFNPVYSKDASYLGSSTLGSRYIRFSFAPVDYFNAMQLAANKQNLDKNLYRKMYLIEYHIYASTQEYMDYLEYSKPSLSFNQTKPLYSNFDKQAALGLFTFRAETIIQKEMAKQFIDAFSYNPATCQYKFYNSNNIWQGCD